MTVSVSNLLAVHPLRCHCEPRNQDGVLHTTQSNNKNIFPIQIPCQESNSGSKNMNIMKIQGVVSIRIKFRQLFAVPYSGRISLLGHIIIIQFYFGFFWRNNALKLLTLGEFKQMVSANLLFLYSGEIDRVALTIKYDQTQRTVKK